MNDLISRSELIEEIKNIEVKIDYDALNKLVEDSKDEDTLETIIKYVMWQTSEIAMQHIENAPTIEAVPVVRGEWMEAIGENYWFDYTCSICGELEEFEYNFCPNCGADMRKKVE